MKGYFKQEATQISTSPGKIKRGSTSRVIREMQMQTTVRSHFTRKNRFSMILCSQSSRTGERICVQKSGQRCPLGRTNWKGCDGGFWDLDMSLDLGAGYV